MNQTQKNSNRHLWFALALAGILLIFALRTLVAHVFFERAGALVRESHEPEDLDIDWERIRQNNLTAIRYLKWSIAVVPTRSVYYKALSDVHVRLARRRATLELMQVQLPDGAQSSKESFAEAETALKKAIDLEPTNPDYHFSLAVVYDAQKEQDGKAEKELDRAVTAFPVNAALRYAVALQHLNAGRKGQALEHARALARLAAGNDSFSNGEWLIRAFDLAWLASRDLQVVQGMAPDDPAALSILKRYLKEKGITL